MRNKHTDLEVAGSVAKRDDVSENLFSEFYVPSSGSLILLILLKSGRPLYFVMTQGGSQCLILGFKV